MAENRLRVLEICMVYAPEFGGVQMVAQRLAEGLQQRAEVTVLCCSGAPKDDGHRGLPGEERLNGVRVVRARSLARVFSMMVSFDLFRQCRRLAREADVILLHMPFPLGELAALLCARRKPLVIWWHSDIVRQRALLPLYGPLRRAVLSRARSVLTATRALRDATEALQPCLQKCRVIPFGLDVDGFVAGADAVSPLSDSGQPGQFRLLFVGRLVYYKGMNVLLNALKDAPGVQLYAVGEGPLLAEYRAQAAALGLDGRVCWLGRLPEGALKACYRDCHALALPSIYPSEAFGLVQLEAMAFGKPVINTALPSGVPEVSVDGLTGLTVPPGDEKALARAIRLLAEDKNMLERLGKAAQARVRETYSMKRMLEETDDALREAAISPSVCGQEKPLR